jgi:hypothetical protein
MVAMHEQRVSTLAHRVGLRLTRDPTSTGVLLYRLTEPAAEMAIFPGGVGDGAPLGEWEDWLQRPWE